MGSNGAQNVPVIENYEAKGSNAMAEIKIKTMDSQTYTLLVDKCVPVLELKEQIATVTGMLSEQQRLICRGKVLKDDQLLSAYDVEDGHTLHLVASQPIAPLGENASASTSEYNGEIEVHLTLSNQGDGIPNIGQIRDIGQIFPALFNSIEINRTGSGSEDFTINESAFYRSYIMSGRDQNDEPGMRDQPISSTSTASYPSGPRSDPLQPQVFPDSLTTLTQYLSHLTQECDATIERGQNNTSQTAGSRGVGAEVLHATGTLPAGLPTPASLAEVLMSTRHLLNEKIEECLLQVARYMENQANVTDLVERMDIEEYAFRSGRLVQNLGAFLLELGRPMMALQMCSTPADAMVNTGPALFVSVTGPNPMTVQPQPFLPGTSHGAVPIGTSQQSSGFVGGSVGTGFIPRNTDIRIDADVDRINPTGSPPTSAPNINNSPPSHLMSSEGPGNASTRDLETRVVPLESVYVDVPASVGPEASESTHASLGVVYPALERVHHVSSGDANVLRSSQVPDQHARIDGNGRSSMPNPAAQLPNSGVPDLDSSNISVGGTPSDQGFCSQVHDGRNKFLRTILSGEHQHIVAGSENTTVATDVNNSQHIRLPASDDGVPLIKIHLIMPLISETIETTCNVSSVDGENAPLGSAGVSASSEQGNSLLPPSPKRQKRE